MPFVAWCNDYGGWQPCKESIKEQLGSYDEFADALVNSMEVGVHKDVDVLRPGVWVLCYIKLANGLPNKRHSPWWFCAGRLVKNAYRYTHNRKVVDAVFPMEQRSPEPFDLIDALFLQSLWDVLERHEYEQLRTDNYKGAWFALNQELTRCLWRDLKQRYLELTG